MRRTSASGGEGGRETRLMVYLQPGAVRRSRAEFHRRRRRGPTSTDAQVAPTSNKASCKDGRRKTSVSHLERTLRSPCGCAMASQPGFHHFGRRRAPFTTQNQPRVSRAGTSDADMVEIRAADEAHTSEKGVACVRRPRASGARLQEVSGQHATLCASFIAVISGVPGGGPLT